MTEHPVGTPDEWPAARLELLEAERTMTVSVPAARKYGTDGR